MNEGRARMLAAMGRGVQWGRGSVKGLRLLLAGIPGKRPACLVPSGNSDTYHFHRKRAGARRIRRYLRRNPAIAWVRVHP